jgi:hypothetical protein
MITQGSDVALPYDPELAIALHEVRNGWLRRVLARAEQATMS